MKPAFGLRWWKQPLAIASLVAGLSCMAWAQSVAPLATNRPIPEAGATLTFANQPICVFRAKLNGYSPEQRAMAAAERLRSVLADARHMLVSTQAVATGIQITLDGKPLFVITPGDASSLSGQTVEGKAATVVAALRSALHQTGRLSTAWQILRAIGEALFGLMLFAALVWAARQTKRWLLMRSARLVAKKTERVGSRELRTATARAFVAVLRAVLNFAFYLFIAFLGYALLWYELRAFPYSRPWGDYLRSQCISGLVSLARGLLAALPSLAVVVLIALAGRLLTQVLSKIFASVERGEIRARRLDPATATTTRRILVFVIWVIVIMVAYPYIPGSQTLAFKGVTVFVGLVISLGSTNIVNQIASGLLLIYSRAFRTGDYVRVEEAEGTVLEIGLCATRIRSIKNEEVYIANSVLLGTATKNYSQLAESEGVLLWTRVTIGYSTPWRQVHAMLLEAARRTAGLAGDPEPFVLQTSLSDFYVEYEVNARLERPEQRVWVLSDLHTHIQDVFNEHGVQIMSPHYWQDPLKPQVVPKANWFPPPAVEAPPAAQSFAWKGRNTIRRTE